MSSLLFSRQLKPAYPKLSIFSRHYKNMPSFTKALPLEHVLTQKFKNAPPLCVLLFSNNRMGIPIAKKLQEAILLNQKTNIPGQIPIRYLEIVCPLPLVDSKICERDYEETGGALLKEWAEKNNILVSKVPQGPMISEWFVNKGFDLGVVAEFPGILPERLIRRFPMGIINVHASMLPKYRGWSPVTQAILDKADTTGVSVANYKPSVVDGGNVFLQKEVKLDPTANRQQVYDLLTPIAADLTLKVAENISNYRRQEKKDLSDSDDFTTATFSKRYFDDSCTRIEWEKSAAEDLYRKHLAFHGMYPLHATIRTPRGVERVELLDVRVAAMPSDTQEISNGSGSGDGAGDVPVPGALCLGENKTCLQVRCADGGSILVSKIKVDIVTMDAAEFAAEYLADPRSKSLMDGLQPEWKQKKHSDSNKQ